MDLSLVQISDMLSEIEKRADAFVFISIKKIDKDTDEHRFNIYGSRATCVGLLTLATKSLLKNINFVEKDFYE